MALLFSTFYRVDFWAIPHSTSLSLSSSLSSPFPSPFFLISFRSSLSFLFSMLSFLPLLLLSSFSLCFNLFLLPPVSPLFLSPFPAHLLFLFPPSPSPRFLVCSPLFLLIYFHSTFPLPNSSFLRPLSLSLPPPHILPFPPPPHPLLISSLPLPISRFPSSSSSPAFPPPPPPPRCEEGVWSIGGHLLVSITACDLLQPCKIHQGSTFNMAILWVKWDSLLFYIYIFFALSHVHLHVFWNRLERLSEYIYRMIFKKIKGDFLYELIKQININKW